MPSTQPQSPLPSTHPLISELSSLRQQLAAYQKASHVASISLQGARLELALSKEEADRSRRESEGLRKEVEVLRNNPAPPPLAPTSTALTQLSLAHRRLSSKLDLTESQLTTSQLELARAQQEVQRLTRERDGDRAVLNELKRIEEDREEELEWERGERKKAEHQKKLCDLALQEYSTLVHSLDPSAVPPEIPSKPAPSLSHAPSLPHSTPSDGETSTLTEPSPTMPSPSSPSVSLSSPETISNLLIGQKGVHQLFNDFTSILITKDKSIHSLESRVEELEHSVKVAEEQLAAETNLRVEAESERDKALRDDASASRVVERYMTFTQKTHATVHMHLDNLRTRSQATATTLRSELTSLKKSLAAERQRSEKLRLALDELSEGMSREAAGRRRETALRLKMLAVDEKRARKAEAWLDRVRRTRDGAEGAVAEADVLESLLDEGVEAVSEGHEVTDVGKDKQRSWRGLGLLGKRDKSKGKNQPQAEERNPEEESLARILLAEELVTTLVGDLQVETERRLELECQRVEWLAKEAAQGVEAGLGHEHGDHEDGEGTDGHVMFDLDDEDHGDHHVVKEDATGRDKTNEPLVDASEAKPTPTPLKLDDSVLPAADLGTTHSDTSSQPTVPEAEIQTEQSPLVAQLSELFSPLTTRYTPLQKDLHDLSHALTGLRSSLTDHSDESPLLSPSSPKSAKSKKSHFLSLSRQAPSPSAGVASDPTLSLILDGIHEVIEDARVDVEIALADHERVYRGFEALLDVGTKGKKNDIMDQVREYADAKSDNNDQGWKKLKKRVGEVEGDLTEVKRIIHEAEGMEVSHNHDQDHDHDDDDGDDGAQDGSMVGRRGGKSVWDGIQLKTVTIPTSSTVGLRLSPLPSPLIDGLSMNSSPTSPGFDPRRRTSSMLSSVGSVGRTLSNSVIGAPRRVSGLASGLYRGANGPGPGAGGGGASPSESKFGFGLSRKNEDKEKEGLMRHPHQEDDVE